MKFVWSVIVGVAFGTIFGLLGAGLLLLFSRPPRGKVVLLSPIPTPVPIKVHIQGAVLHPGLYALPIGSRIQDAIEEAGGFSTDANTDTLNLASLLQDGNQIVVPSMTTTINQNLPPPKSSPQSTIQQININTASIEELEGLPGIGEVSAKRIIEYRSQNGNFVTIQDIQKVTGIGNAIFQKIKDLITVGY